MKTIYCQNEIAQTLYHDYAKELLIIDYHCHLDPKEIYEDRPFKTITEAWLVVIITSGGWCALVAYPKKRLRAMPVIMKNFGMVSNSAKIGGKSYSWTHLELKRFFCDRSSRYWRKCRNFVEAMQRKIAAKDFTRRALIARSNVRDRLHHRWSSRWSSLSSPLSQTEQRFRVLPTRPWQSVTNRPSEFSYLCYQTRKECRKRDHYLRCFLDSLAGPCNLLSPASLPLVWPCAGYFSVCCGRTVISWSNFCQSISWRIFGGKRSLFFKTNVLVELMKLYHEHGWTMQLHVHAYRNCNQRMFERLGPDTATMASMINHWLKTCRNYWTLLMRRTICLKRFSTP